MANLNAGQMKEGWQEDDWNTQKEQNKGALFFSVSANKDVWACWLLIGEDSDNKELIPHEGPQWELSQVIKVWNVFLCLPTSLRSLHFFPLHI